MNGCPHCGNEDDESLKCAAQREDVLFASFKHGVETQHSVSVIMPIHECTKCGFKWSDQNGEVIRDFAVEEARAKLV